MRKTIASLTAATLMLANGGALAGGGSCNRPQDAAAIHTAAMQMEMMVAAFACSDIAAYNDFVLSHRAELQASDRVLLKFFMQASPKTGDGDYNLYKTELANGSSMRSLHDPQFCSRVNANFAASTGRTPERALSEIPFPMDTGSVRCEWAQATQAAANAAAAVDKEGRTLLGQLENALPH